MAGERVAMFCWDGTLADTMEQHARLATRCILKYFGGYKLDEAEALKLYTNTTGLPFHEQLDVMFKGDQYVAAKACCAREYHDAKLAEVYEGAKLFDDVPDGLEILKRKGVGMFVSTAAERDIVMESADRLGIGRYFEVVAGCENGGKASHVRAVKVKYAPEELFFVCDSPFDVVALSSAKGCTAIARHGNKPGMHTAEQLKYYGAKHVTDDLRSLMPFISGDWIATLGEDAGKLPKGIVQAHRAL